MSSNWSNAFLWLRGRPAPSECLLWRDNIAKYGRPDRVGFLVTCQANKPAYGVEACATLIDSCRSLGIPCRTAINCMPDWLNGTQSLENTVKRETWDGLSSIMRSMAKLRDNDDPTMTFDVEPYAKYPSPWLRGAEATLVAIDSLRSAEKGKTPRDDELLKQLVEVRQRVEADFGTQEAYWPMWRQHEVDGAMGGFLATLYELGIEPALMSPSIFDSPIATAVANAIPSVAMPQGSYTWHVGPAASVSILAAATASRFAVRGLGYVPGFLEPILQRSKQKHREGLGSRDAFVFPRNDRDKLFTPEWQAR